jgi:hypothetical protein
MPAKFTAISSGYVSTSDGTLKFARASVEDRRDL